MVKKTAHSFVHNITIASPCSANWEEMTGNERQRHCHDCKKNVYNIAEMTIAEAEELIITNEGRVCVRLFRRHDGTVLTKDCPVGLALVRARLAKASAAVVAVVAVVSAWALNWRAGAWDAPLWKKLVDSTNHCQTTVTPPISGNVSPRNYEVKGRMVMGDMAAPPVKSNHPMGLVVPPPNSASSTGIVAPLPSPKKSGSASSQQ